MSGVAPHRMLKLCEVYVELSEDARHVLRWLDIGLYGKRVDCLVKEYAKLAPSDQHEFTRFLEIAASENVWTADVGMDAVHEYNDAHPRSDRRAWWELEAH